MPITRRDNRILRIIGNDKVRGGPIKLWSGGPIKGIGSGEPGKIIQPNDIKKGQRDPMSLRPIESQHMSSSTHHSLESL